MIPSKLVLESGEMFPGFSPEWHTAGYKIRRLAIDHHIPLITNLQLAQIFLQCLAEMKELPIHSLREITSL
jgi:hypothetical protein